MENNWKKIWSSRNALQISEINLIDLIALDGFDAGAGKIEIEDWRKYASSISAKLNLKAGDSVYEVGCGGGAFLYALCENLQLKIGGNDYGEGLINAARKVFPSGDFECVEAAKIDTKTKYDYVISNGVFHYFEEVYAEDVLLKMIEKSRNGVCVLEIPDIKTRSESEKMRRELLSHEEYEKKYKGLQHTYYDRAWFVNVAEKSGRHCEVFDGCVPNYAQNKFRFGILIK